MKGIISKHELLHQIAQENYKNHIKYSKLYNDLTNNNEQWDILAKTKEKNGLYFRYFKEMDKSAIIAVVFLVISVEGLINEYGLKFLGEKRFSQLEKEKLCTLQKMKKIYNLVTENSFPTDRQLYQNIKELISVRNTFVHSKSMEIDYQILFRNDPEAQKEFSRYLNFMMGNRKEKESRQKLIFEVLNNSITVYDELKGIFHEG